MTKISFIGDISLNDKYNERYRSKENPFKQVSSILHDADYVVGNLECIAESNDGKENTLKKPRLKTGTETLNYLKEINLSLATLAHNHIYDNLLGGFLNTVSFLKNNKIDYSGSGLSKTESSKAIIKNIDNTSICFLNYVTSDTNPNLPDESEIRLNIFDENTVIDDIKKNRQNDFVILILHWGGNFEGGNYPSIHQRQLAKRLIDAGADLIVGHHSHTLQPFEKYKGKYIFYSLGNFCFADILSDGRIKPIDRKRFKRSIILSLNLEGGSVKVQKTFIKNVNLNIVPDKSGKYEYRIKQMMFTLMKRTYIFWYMYYFFYKFIDPVVYQIYRKDTEKSFFFRLKNLNFSKIKALTKQL